MEDASLGRIAALTGVKEAATEGATNPDRVTKTLARELSLCKYGGRGSRRAHRLTGFWGALSDVAQSDLVQ